MYFEKRYPVNRLANGIPTVVNLTFLNMLADYTASGVCGCVRGD